jgi:hypothetical protein
MKAIETFKTIGADSELYAFLKRYTFAEDTRQMLAQFVGVCRGPLDGAATSVTHRWNDPSGPFQNEQDIHKAKLVVTGHRAYEVPCEG